MINKAIIDDFGLGIETIKIRGNTGWNTRFQPRGVRSDGNFDASRIDGYSAYRILFFDIYKRYHELRKRKRKQELVQKPEK